MRSSFVTRPGARLAWLLAALAPVFAPAMAALPAGPRPLITPTHPVTIDYIVTTADAGTLDMRVASLPGGKRLQITSPELPTMLLINRADGVAEVVLPVLRAFSRMDIRGMDPETTILRDASFTRRGQAKIAGRACTRWQAESPQGAGEGCFTADGVLLEGALRSTRRGELVRVIARAVADYAPPPQDFDVPEGFSESPFQLNPKGFGK